MRPSGNEVKPQVKVTVFGDFVPSKETAGSILSSRNCLALIEIESLLEISDLSIVNLESPLSIGGKKRADLSYYHKSSPELAHALKRAGFSIACLANNHIRDLSDEGVHDTIRACKDAGLDVVGAGANIQTAATPLIRNTNGIKIAFIAVAENELSIATESSPGANPLDPITNCSAIIQLKKAVDHVVVILHGGNEYWSFPRPGLVKLCRHYVDVGASAIVCHHTHVFGGYEIYKGAPILYGLGNFLFDRKKPIPTGWNHGLVASFTFSKTELLSNQMIPIENIGGRIVILKDSKKQSVLDRVEEIANVISDSKLLRSEWEQYCAQRYDDYIEYVSCLGFIERNLRPIFPRLIEKTTAKRVKTLFNIVNCESHRELLLETLSMYLNSYWKD